MSEQSYEAPDTIRAMLSAASAFLAALPSDQSASALLPMDDPRRLDWDFVPKPDRNGVPLAALDRHQRVLAHNLIARGFSLRGYGQALTIMAMENVLRELQVRTMGIAAGAFRNPDEYFLSFYGRPALEDTWGWRVLGHHLSVSYTIIDQRLLTVTPCNMGAQPAQSGVLAPLRTDEDLGFALLDSLTEQQRKTTVIHHRAPADYATRQVPLIGEVEYPDYYDLGILSYQLDDSDREALKFVRDEPAGICGADLDEAQAQLLLQITDWYFGRVPDEVADVHRRRLERHGLGNLFFSWAGGEQRGTPHYYRVHGHDVLIEFDNAIDQGNHIHSVWRDLNNDLGHDLLLDHYERERLTGHHLRSRLTSSRPRAPRAAQAPARPEP